MLEKIREYLEKNYRISPGDVQKNTSLKDDLGLSSLDLFQMLTDAEKAFKIRIPAEMTERIRTVGDMLDLMNKYGLSD